jgi:predicted transposase/invertase (TIGR01784 family)
MSEYINEYKYINPFTDYGFKLLFGTEANKDLLIDFLNCVFSFEHPIMDVIFQNVEQTPETHLERKAVYDVYCTNSIGDRFIIEMQKGKLTYFKDRALFYLTFPITAMSKRGDWDFRLDEIYYLALLDFEYEPSEHAKVDRYVQLIDQYGEVFYDKLHLKFIQLPAFKKEIVDLQSRYEQWLYFLRELETFEDIPTLFDKDQKFKKVISIAEIAKLKPAEAKKYNLSRMQYLENKGVVDAAFADGKQEGIDEMLDLLNQERKEKEQAELLAKQERKNHIASIRALAKAGIEKQIIATANGITLDELQELLDSE